MEQPSHWGDELALHLFAVMNQIHYCIIMKTKVYYSHPTAFPSPSAMHITLVYLENSIFRDTTTLSKKCPPPPLIDFNQPLPSRPLQEQLTIKTRRSRNGNKSLSLSMPRNNRHQWKSTSMPSNLPLERRGQNIIKHPKSRYTRQKNIKFIIKGDQ